ncbi:HupE/UreJ family protein [Saccharospirillum salsuginis]|uniref:Protein hupE n=1 Tax=Saccharospirillum salsuginis TaxID=418750 RepID=A0A918N5W7_9GAMM|nr:HupE/UreJ family protein [Saccharospirillum salsuginis]GGX43619.1 protein hupE [Saccharospirillum salsuginis]
MTGNAKHIGLFILTGFPTLALAHTGHGTESGFTAGLTHPIGGLDHILALVAVGFWGAHLGGSARWQLPLAFVAAMLVGGALGMAGIALPGVEPMILVSSIVIGLALAISGKLNTGLAAALCAGFAIFHGVAHGAEMPVASSALGYAAGFALATAALHVCGLASAQVARRVPSVHRWAGVLFAVGGLVFGLS